MKKSKKTDKETSVKRSQQKTKETPSDRENRIRKILINQRNEILKEAKQEISNFTKGEEKQIVETALDDGDWSVVDLSEDIILKKLSQHKINLNRIDETLRKLKQGTYGICEECGSEINEGRLKIMPFAIYCVDCMERIEKLEEIESFE